MKIRFLAVLFICITFWPNLAAADSLADLLKEAVEEYVEDKAEEAGLVPEGESRKQEVNFTFTGATAPPPDVFRVAHTSSSPPGSSSGTQTATEQDCFNRVQNKIAWNNSGQKAWSPFNIKALCKGTTNPSQPPSCFSRAMFNGNQWGKKPSHKMNWSLASKLCAGTNNSNQQINCLKQKIAQNKSLSVAINACSSNFKAIIYKPTVLQASPAVLTTVINYEQLCFNNIQGKVSWTRGKSSKQWAESNVKKLCKGTRSATAPRSCFNYIFHYPHKWRKTSSQTIGWSGAIDLCEGTSNSTTTINCFKSSIASGKSVAASIAKCDK